MQRPHGRCPLVFPQRRETQNISPEDDNGSTCRLKNDPCLWGYKLQVIILEGSKTCLTLVTSDAGRDSVAKKEELGFVARGCLRSNL